MITLDVPKNTGNYFGHFVRQLTLNSVDYWKPIAFKLKGFEHPTLLHTRACVLQDLIEVQANLLKLDFRSEDSLNTEDFIIMSVQGNNITSDMLTTADNKLHCTTKGVKLLTSIDMPCHLDIYFRRYHGTSTVEDNSEFLKTHGYSSDITLMSSIHSSVSLFTYKIKPLDNEKEVIEIISNDDTAVTRAIQLAKKVTLEI